MSNREPRIGPAVYRALDGKSDLACVITKVEHEGSASARGAHIDFWSLCITVFPPSGQPQFYTRIKFDRDATLQSAKPGTCYV